MKQEFETKLMARGPNGAWIYFNVPFDVQKVFGSKARVPVKGTINGHPFRTSIIPQDSAHYLAVNKEMQKGANATAGDTVAVVMERDEAPRTVAVPKDLAIAFSGDTAAKSAFEAMSYSKKKEFVSWIEEAKRPETRAQRVRRSLEMLPLGEHPKK